MVHFPKTQFINIPDILVAFANLARSASKCGFDVILVSLVFLASVSLLSGLGKPEIIDIIGGGGVGGLMVGLLTVSDASITVGAAVVVMAVANVVCINGCLKSTSSLPNKL